MHSTTEHETTPLAVQRAWAALEAAPDPDPGQPLAAAELSAPLPAGPPIGQLTQALEVAEQHGWQLHGLLTYSVDGEAKQHPPSGWPERTGLPALRDDRGRQTHGFALNLDPSGVVDIDCDCDEARAMAPQFLPPTATFGRDRGDGKGLTTSHYLYRTEKRPHVENGGPADRPKKKVFKTASGTTLLEIRRGQGHQTIIPPTVKPCGSQVVWLKTPESLEGWTEDVEQAVGDLALAILVARNGRGHESRLEWAAALLDLGIDIDRAERIMIHACKYRGDEDLDDVRTVLESTAARIERRETVRGVGREVLDDLQAFGFEQGAGGAVDTRPRVTVGGDLARQCDAISGALVARGAPTLFRFGNAITDATGRILEIQPLRLSLAKRIRFEKAPNKDGECLSATPGRDVVEAWAKSCDERVPELRFSRAAPLIRRDGSLFLGHGYDPATSGYSTAAWSGPVIGEDRENAIKAMGVLLWFAGCRSNDELGQFATENDVFAWVAHALTVASRDLIDGAVPLFVYDAAAPGSGKTALARSAARIGNGDGAVAGGDFSKEEEVGRRLAVRALKPDALFDNLKGRVSSPTLEGALTNGEFSARLLHLGPVTVPFRSVLAVTSNGAELSPDLQRRAVMVSLRARKPDARRNLLAEIGDAHRASATTIIRAFLRSGHRYTGTSMASFAEWSELIGGIFEWLTNDDLVGKWMQARVGLATDDDVVGLLRALRDAYGTAKFTTKELLASSDLALRRALSGLFGDVDLSPTTVGRRLKHLASEDLALERSGSRQGVAVWSVVSR